MKIYQVMLFNSLILIILGIYGYTIPPHSYTSFISTGVGLILLILSFPVKKEKPLFSHLAVGLTALTTVVFYIVGIIRSNIIIILMATVSFLAFAFYISDFLKRKAERERNSSS